MTPGKRGPRLSQIPSLAEGHLAHAACWGPPWAGFVANELSLARGSGGRAVGPARAQLLLIT
eukprot:13960381-Alexandrium_andersonii.AAC.1